MGWYRSGGRGFFFKVPERAVSSTDFGMLRTCVYRHRHTDEAPGMEAGVTWVECPGRPACLSRLDGTLGGDGWSRRSCSSLCIFGTGEMGRQDLICYHSAVSTKDASSSLILDVWSGMLNSKQRKDVMANSSDGLGNKQSKALIGFIHPFHFPICHNDWAYTDKPSLPYHGL